MLTEKKFIEEFLGGYLITFVANCINVLFKILTRRRTAMGSLD